jgi:hypothetical protein
MILPHPILGSGGSGGRVNGLQPFARGEGSNRGRSPARPLGLEVPPFPGDGPRDPLSGIVDPLGIGWADHLGIGSASRVEGGVP